jgi:hypothetical protein
MSYINKAGLKKLALELAGKRAHKFTRVSKSFYDAANRYVAIWALQHIASLPSKGKTIS